MRNDVLLAFAVLRRAVVVCRFRGVALDHAGKRDLRSAFDDAKTSAEAFVVEVLEDVRPDRVAVEVRPGSTGRLKAIASEICRLSLERGIPVWRVPEHEVLAAYGEPPIGTRGELRKTIRSLWPILTYYPKLAPGSLDAAALALYVQVSSDLESAETEGSLDVA